jgi:hypothetical protein
LGKHAAILVFSFRNNRNLLPETEIGERFPGKLAKRLIRFRRIDARKARPYPFLVYYKGKSISVRYMNYLTGKVSINQARKKTEKPDCQSSQNMRHCRPSIHLPERTEPVNAQPTGQGAVIVQNLLPKNRPSYYKRFYGWA